MIRRLLGAIAKSDPLAKSAAAVFAFAGLFVAGFFAIRAAEAPVRLSIEATQTAEARATASVPPPSVLLTPSSLLGQPTPSPLPPSEVPIPTLTLEHISPLAFRAGFGRTDTFRLTNVTTSPITVVGYGARIDYGQDQVIMSCSEAGLCFSPCGPYSDELPSPIASICVRVLPEDIFWREDVEWDLAYPLRLEPGDAVDFVASEDVITDPADAQLSTSVTITYFLQLSDGEQIEAPALVARVAG
jgi:hypothetical protein